MSFLNRLYYLFFEHQSDATKPNKTTGRTKEKILREDTRTPREKQYEEEIQALKAKVTYYEKLESLQPFFKKNQKSGR